MSKGLPKTTLLACRRFKGLTQADMSRRLKMSPYRLSCLERNREKLTLKDIRAYARVMGVGTVTVMLFIIEGLAPEFFELPPKSSASTKRKRNVT